MTVRVIPPHGTRARYSHRDPSIKCRLKCCQEANARYQQRYRREGPERWTTRPDGYRQMRIPIPTPSD